MPKIREISKNKVRKPPPLPPPFVWKCGHSPLKMVNYSLGVIENIYFLNYLKSAFYLKH